MSEVNFSLVIPCFNEGGNLPKLINLCVEELCSKGVEVILIDNGSYDRSGKILKDASHEHSLLRTFRLEKNAGYGGGIIYGLSKAKGCYIGWTHSDLQTDPKDAFKAFSLANSSKDFIKGRRKGRPLSENIFSICMALFESLLFKQAFWDINAQPTIFSKDFFLSWEDPPKDFSLDLFAYALAKKKKLKIHRFDVLFPKRYSGKSSWNRGFRSRLLLIKRTIIFSFTLMKKFN